MSGAGTILAGRFREAATLVAETAREARRITCRVARGLGRRWPDIAIAFGLGLVFAVVAVLHFRAFDPRQLLTAFDIWFEADVPRVVEGLFVRDSAYNYRSSVHPLFPLLFSTPALILRAAGLSIVTVVTLYVAAGAFLLGALIYATLRSFGLRRVDGALLALALPATAGGMFWMAVPETYVWGGSTILIPFLWLSIRRREWDGWSAPVQSAISMCVTVTNWMAGLAAAFVALPFRRALAVSIAGFAIIAALTPIQNAIFPKAGRFLNFKQEVIYTVADGRNARPQPVERAVGMLVHNLVAPAPRLLQQAEPLAPWKLSNLSRLPFDDALAALAWAGWAMLMAIGLWSAWRGAVRAELVAMSGLVLAGNFALHFVYGEDVFLFALHFAPLYLILMSWAFMDRLRAVALGVLIVTAPLSYIANARQFARGVAAVNSGRYTVDSGITGYTHPPLVVPAP